MERLGLDEYKKAKVISNTDLYEGLLKTFNNAKSLFDEADLLASKEYYCRAYTLFQLGIEELGKCKLLHHCILQYYLGHYITSDGLIKAGFMRHTDKSKIIFYQCLQLAKLFEKMEGIKIDSFEEIEKNFINAGELDKMKNQSLYVDIKSNKFISPDEKITKSDYETIFYKANLLCCIVEKILIRPLDELKLFAQAIKKGEKNFGKKIYEA